MKNKIIIGITGPFGSGKSTAASFFETKGYHKIVLSSFLENELKTKGILITRKNLQDLGNEWRKVYGPGILAEKALKFIKDNNIGKAVIDGIRNLAEINKFNRSANFVLLGVVADRDIRFERIKKLKNREELTKDVFNKLDYRDLGINEDIETGLQVAKCLAISDYFINSNDEKGYGERLGEFLIKI